MIRAVIFDFNGILVDDEHLHFELFRELLAERGVNLTEAAYFTEYIGYDDKTAFATALERAELRESPVELQALIEEKTRRYLVRAKHDLRFFDDADECVRRLASRWPVAVNSGALRAEIELALDEMGISEWVCAIVSAEDTERSKPDPEGYLLTLDALRALHGEDLEAGHCVAIEDTSAGVLSAKGAGMWVVGITNTTDEPSLRRAGADVVCSTLVGLDEKWLRSMFLPEISP